MVNLTGNGTRRGLAVAGAVVSMLFAGGIANAQIVAFDAPTGTVGSQSYSGNIGYREDFDVLKSITVTSLGYFDYQGDGLHDGNTVTVTLYDRTGGGTALQSQSFTGTVGSLAPGSTYRFLNLSSGIDLAAGFQGAIVADGFLTASDPAGNTFSGDPAVLHGPNQDGTTATGSQLISYPTQLAYYSIGTPGLPTTPDTLGVYMAGSFQYNQLLVTTPEPSGLAFGLTAFGTLSLLARRRRNVRPQA